MGIWGPTNREATCGGAVLDSISAPSARMALAPRLRRRRVAHNRSGFARYWVVLRTCLGLPYDGWKCNRMMHGNVTAGRYRSYDMTPPGDTGLMPTWDGSNNKDHQESQQAAEDEAQWR